MVPWDSRIDVLVGLADGVHDGGAGHSVVELDGVDGWGVIFHGDEEPFEVL